MSRKPLLALLTLTLIVFARVLHFEFLSWDDRIFIFENPILSMPFAHAAHAAFTGFFFGDYLPLTQMSLWLDTNLFGAPNSQISHAVNLALHLINITLLAGFLRNELKRGTWLTETVAWVALVFFALHPLQVESVAWVSERKGLLSATFALMALCLFSRREENKSALPLYYLSYLGSMLAKTSNLGLPLAVLVYDRVAAKTPWRAAILRQVPALVIGAGIGGLRVYAYANLTSGMYDAFSESTRWLLLPLQIANAIGFYLRQILFPNELSPIYPPFRLDISNWIQVLILAIFIFFSWRASRRSPGAPILFAFFILFLAPVLQIVPRLSYVNDRYCYMPLWAAAGVFASFFPRYEKSVNAWAFAPLAILLSLSTHSQLSMWRTNLNFWNETVRLRPDSGVAWLSLGQAFENEHEYMAAAGAYEKAAEVGPEVRARAFSNLAGLHSDSARQDMYDLNKAELYLQSALKDDTIRSEKPGLLYNFARLRFLQGRVEEAGNLCREIITDIESRHDLRFESVKALAEKCFQP